MLTWEYPALIAVGAAGAMVVSLLLLRAAQRPRGVDFACSVCGRKQAGLGVRAWRYCPWCGAPKGGSLRDLPKKRSILDIDGVED